MERILDYRHYAALARQCAAEGCVLLENRQNALPLSGCGTAAVFGRMQLNSYSCGTGSGGMVNPPYVVSILEGLQRQLPVYPALAEHYRSWTAQHPFDKGGGWAQEPWSQEEMPLSEELVQDAADHAEAAVAVIGRTAGEDKDNTPLPGGFYLTEKETTMLRQVRAAFSRMIVVLNIGGIIDMNWIDDIGPDAVLIVWQGGCETGNAVADVLTGAVPPCGKLPDTIARQLCDYPSSSNFGGETQNIYAEDIYVGYRYFETFQPDSVRYPFGYGKTYSQFIWSVRPESRDARGMRLLAAVKNDGRYPGKEVLQFYVCPPQGALGKPVRNLVAFHKTKLLQPGETETFSVPLSSDAFASYDDSGATGYPNAWVLEPGAYSILAGFDVRQARRIAVWEQPETRVCEQLRQAAAPHWSFQRLKPVKTESDGRLAPSLEAAPVTQTAGPQHDSLPETPCRGDRGWRWDHLRRGRVTVEDFLSQLSDEALICLTRAEGMCSPKVTPGTAGAFGGITPELRAYGIPAACCADGPSGIRMDCGAMAFSIPIGTALASTFHPELVRALFADLGLELVKNRVDTMLGPGVNLHRHPLCGRNFEYFSEDPFLAGTLCCAELDGLRACGVTGTVKHFACNNQEHRRNEVNAIVSERALRELYLKPFEMAVKQGSARSIMSAYNPINGTWSASHHELLTAVLRDQWGYRGMVMTDWWAEMNDEGGLPGRTNAAAMLRAQNDIYMVTADDLGNSGGDNAAEALKDGRLTRGELLRSAGNICRFILASPASEPVHPADSLRVEHAPKQADAPASTYRCDILRAVTELHIADADTRKGSALRFALHFPVQGAYSLCWRLHSAQAPLSQMPVSIRWNGTLLRTVILHGTENVRGMLPLDAGAGAEAQLELYFGESGVEIDSLRIETGSQTVS